MFNLVFNKKELLSNKKLNNLKILLLKKDKYSDNKSNKDSKGKDLKEFKLLDLVKLEVEEEEMVLNHLDQDHNIQSEEKVKVKEELKVQDQR